MKLIVCGGHDGDAWLNSVESFDWQKNAWQQEAVMTTKRCAAAAFVLGHHMFVSGGSNDSQFLETVERCHYTERLQWEEFNGKIPIKCVGHSVVGFDQKVFMCGGNSSSNPPQVSNRMYSISMNSPFTSDELRNMPVSRHDHGSVIIDDKVLVFGGRTSDQAKDSVYGYSIASNQWRTLPSLPYPVSEMAVVSYKSHAILIGGVLANGEVLNKVLAYNANTCEFQWLPSLNHRRYGCAAVIAGNIIVVVGGQDDDSYLDSVECLDLSKNAWQEMSPMNVKRYYATAALLPLYEDLLARGG